MEDVTSNSLDFIGTSMAISGTDLLEVPTIYKAYFSGLRKGISPTKYGQKCGTNVPPFYDPEIPIENMYGTSYVYLCLTCDVLYIDEMTEICQVECKMKCRKMCGIKFT